MMFPMCEFCFFVDNPDVSTSEKGTPDENFHQGGELANFHI
jgi:hypothetical protein